MHRCGAAYFWRGGTPTFRAAGGIFLGWALIPKSTPSNAHPTVGVMAWLALHGEVAAFTIA